MQFYKLTQEEYKHHVFSEVQKHNETFQQLQALAEEGKEIVKDCKYHDLSDPTYITPDTVRFGPREYSVKELGWEKASRLAQIWISVHKLVKTIPYATGYNTENATVNIEVPFNSEHRASILKALQNGLEVKEAVLNEYPDLLKMKQEGVFTQAIAGIDTPEDIICNAVRDTIPKGAPLPFTEILEAKQVKDKVKGKVVLFDGEIAEIEIGKWQKAIEGSWQIHWEDVKVPFSLENNQWVRDYSICQEEVQLALF